MYDDDDDFTIILFTKADTSSLLCSNKGSKKISSIKDGSFNPPDKTDIKASQETFLGRLIML